MVKDDGGVCIADPAFNILMRQLTYDSYIPTPATWRYKPWEELQNNLTGPQADVYSLASVIYEVSAFSQLDVILTTHTPQMFCGRPPYHDYHGYHYSRGIVKIISHGHRTLDRPLEISPELWIILQKCWRSNPAARLSAPQVEWELRQLV
jgi:serine/threonine protein kinase